MPGDHCWWVLGLGWLVSTVAAGCMPDMETELHEAHMAAHQQASLRLQVYSHVLSDKLLPSSQQWDKTPWWPGGGDLPSAEGTKVLKDVEGRLLVRLTDLRKAGAHAGDDDVAQRTKSRLRTLGGPYGLDDAGYSQAEQELWSNCALSALISHAYPGALGMRCSTRSVSLPGRTEVRQMEWKMPSLFSFRWKPKPRWRTLVRDPCAGLYPAFVGGTFTMPRAADFEARAARCVYRRPMADVWEALTHVASQYQGILAIGGEADRKILVCRRVVPVPNPDPKEPDRPLYEAVVLAIAVVPSADGRCTVHCAPLKPDGTLESLAEASPLLDWPRGRKQKEDVVSAANHLTVARERNQRLFCYLSSPQVTKAALTVPQRAICVHRSFQELGVQIFGPRLWAGKYLPAPAPKPPEGLEAEPLVSPSLVPGKTVPRKYSSATVFLGDEIAETLLATQVRVVDPRIQELVAALIRNLARTGGRMVPQAAKRYEPGLIRAHVIASPDVQAFALPGGKLFICSGLLDTLDNADELAAALAHELSHLLHEDAARLLHERARARRRAEVTNEILTYILAGVGPFLGAGGQIASTAARGAIAGFSASATRVFAEAAVQGYSLDAELRADEFAVAILARTGYRPEGMLDLLNRLKTEQEEAAGPGGTQQRVQSSLINAKPGLPERIRKVQALLDRRRSSR